MILSKFFGRMKLGGFIDRRLFDLTTNKWHKVTRRDEQMTHFMMPQKLYEHNMHERNGARGNGLGMGHQIHHHHRKTQ